MYREKAIAEEVQKHVTRIEKEGSAQLIDKANESQGDVGVKSLSSTFANTLGILRPNFVAMLDGLESRDLCTRIRSTNDRRSHILMLTDKGRAVLARAKKLVATKHEVLPIGERVDHLM